MAGGMCQARALASRPRSAAWKLKLSSDERASLCPSGRLGLDASQRAPGSMGTATHPRAARELRRITHALEAELLHRAEESLR